MLRTFQRWTRRDNPGAPIFTGPMWIFDVLQNQFRTGELPVGFDPGDWLPLPVGRRITYDPVKEPETTVPVPSVPSLANAAIDIHNDIASTTGILDNVVPYGTDTLEEIEGDAMLGHMTLDPISAEYQQLVNSLPPGTYEIQTTAGMATVTKRGAPSAPAPVLPPNDIQMGDAEMATDWGDFLGGLTQDLITQAAYNKWGSPPPTQSFAAAPAVAAAGSAIAAGAGAMGLGLPGVDVVEDRGKGWLYDPYTKKWIKRRHRRKRLLTPTDLSDLAALKSIVGNSESLKYAVIKAVR